MVICSLLILLLSASAGFSLPLLAEVSSSNGEKQQGAHFGDVGKGGIQLMSTLEEVMSIDRSSRQNDRRLISLSQSPDLFLMLYEEEQSTAPLRADELVAALDLTQLNATMAIRNHKGYVPTKFSRILQRDEPYFYLQFQLSPDVKWTYVLMNAGDPMEASEKFVYRLLGGFSHADGVSYVALKLHHDVKTTEKKERHFKRTVIHTGLSLEECLLTDTRYRTQGYVTTVFQTVQDTTGRVHCAVEWTIVPAQEEREETPNSRVEIGSDVAALVLNAKQTTPDWTARQASGYRNTTSGVWQHVLLLSDYRPPDYPAFWTSDSEVPKDYIDGMKEIWNESQLEKIDESVERMMKILQLPSVAVAITKDERLVFASGYGYSNVKSRIPASWRDPYLLASVTKPLTATAIFLLMADLRLKLIDKVFGVDGLLGCDLGPATCENDRLQELTIDHLLQHLSGGWSNDQFANLSASQTVDWRKLPEFYAANVPLANEPGSKFGYSNIGYLLLGEIVEKLSGMNFDEFVNKNVLQPIGVNATGTLLAPSLWDYKSVPTYYDAFYIHPEGRLIDVASVGPAGGLRLSAVDLIKFAVHMDELPLKKDLLPPAAIRLMTTPSRESIQNDAPYGYGWLIDVPSQGWGGYSHSGYIFGGESLMIRGTDGISAVVLNNANLIGSDGYQSAFLRGLVEELKEFPAPPETADLFPTL